MPIQQSSPLDQRETSRADRIAELESMIQFFRSRGVGVTDQGGAIQGSQIDNLTRELDELKYQENAFQSGLTPEERAKLGAQNPNTVLKSHPGGTAEFYDDSYLPLLELLRKYQGGQQGGVPAAYEEILSQFKGKPSDLEAFLQNAAPFIASSLSGTQAFKEMQNLGADDPMQAYGQGLSQITHGAQAGQDQAMRQLSSSGLGRSSARAGIANQAAQTAGAAGSDLYTNLFQQRNQMRRAAASNAFDAHRMVATLALGHNPVPRAEPPPDNTKAAAIGAAGTVVGSLLGGPVGGAIVGTGAKKAAE